MHIFRTTRNYPTVKVVIVGDSDVGKTCLLTSYTSDVVFPLPYKLPRKKPERSFPTAFWIGDMATLVFTNYTAPRTVDNAIVNLSLYDTAGRPEYHRLRPLAYPETNVFNVRTHWHPELMYCAPSSAGIILVGTKLDLREDPKVVEDLANRRTSPVSFSQGDAMARDIGAHKYCECSAFTHQGVNNVFKEAMRVAIIPPPPPSKGPQTSCIVA
ncbi:P-loop containing nucleoside triphosphate hydrolase protein [Gymnopilus junonius]|uniref:P-loop containing nucleoside triphosphate hydrolase protein n=1 Tax=Gymnopilus junonius TaxID=109634 RepID=A0A9P5NI99_GYMJU|nr:P-loop containing nucleoside triphosphate hydrolase protein [Gymnopilus junonius]